MPHGLDPLPEVVILAIGEMFMEQYFALEFKATEEGVVLEVGLVLHEDVVFDLGRSHPSIEMYIIEQNFTPDKRSYRISIRSRPKGLAGFYVFLSLEALR